YVGNGEQAAVAGGELEEVGRQPANGSPLEDGRDRVALLVAGEDGAANEPPQVFTLIEELLEALEILLYLRELPLFLGQLEKCRSVAACYACHDRFVGRHFERPRRVEGIGIFGRGRSP